MTVDNIFYRELREQKSSRNLAPVRRFSQWVELELPRGRVARSGYSQNKEQRRERRREELHREWKYDGRFRDSRYPAEYRNSGIMTFLIGPAGIVYQKDLGEKTVELAQGVTEYNPGEGWDPANQQ